MILARKVRLYPTKEQEQKLWQSVGTARFVYNWTLARQEENYKNGGKFIEDGDLRKEITRLKKNELNWLSNVSNNVAKQAIKDACNGYKNFFKGISNKPRFKSRKKSKPSFYNDNCKLKIKENLVNIEKVGWVEIKEQIPIGVKYYNPRISFDNKYWYIAVGIEEEQFKVELTGESLGIDVGIKDLAICSNGLTFKNINKTKEVKRLKKRLKRKQRQVSRKYEMNKIKKGGENRCQCILHAESIYSHEQQKTVNNTFGIKGDVNPDGIKYKKTKNIIKLEKQIKLLHRRLRNIRSNHIHQATNKIVKTKPSRVVMETLNVKGMMKNRHLSKAIAEQCLYDFKTKIKYKCERYGIEFVEADRWYPSSKTCSKCGKVKKDLKLKDRLYECICGLSIDRDLNASINLSKYKLV